MKTKSKLAETAIKITGDALSPADFPVKERWTLVEKSDILLPEDLALILKVGDIIHKSAQIKFACAVKNNASIIRVTKWSRPGGSTMLLVHQEDVSRIMLLGGVDVHSSILHDSIDDAVRACSRREAVITFMRISDPIKIIPLDYL